MSKELVNFSWSHLKVIWSFLKSFVNNPPKTFKNSLMLKVKIFFSRIIIIMINLSSWNQSQIKELVVEQVVRLLHHHHHRRFLLFFRCWFWPCAPPNLDAELRRLFFRSSAQFRHNSVGDGILAEKCVAIDAHSMDFQNFNF